MSKAADRDRTLGLEDENERLRAELAEANASLDRLHAELFNATNLTESLDEQMHMAIDERDAMEKVALTFRDHNLDARAELARVRALCEPGSPIRAAGLTEQVLAALDGGTE